MVMIQCPNKLCRYIWNYTGKHSYPTRTGCPRCQRKTIIREYVPDGDSK